MSWTARALIAGAALVAAVGGGRLVHSEVRLASHEARRDQTDRREQLLAAETARTASLQLALAEAGLQVRRAEEALTGMRAEMGRAEAELLAAEAQSAADAQRLGELRAREQELAAELALAREASQVSAEQRAALAGQVERLSDDLAAQRAALAQAEEQARTRQGELSLARGRVEELEAAIREARGDAERAAGRAESRARELEEARQALARAEERTRQDQALLARLRAEGVKVDRLGGLRPVPAVRAMVLRVDGQALPMEVLVDVGSRVGLEAGDRLWVVRGAQEVARLEVSEVRPDSATARVVQGDRNSAPRPGDTVLSWRPGQPSPP